MKKILMSILLMIITSFLIFIQCNQDEEGPDLEIINLSFSPTNPSTVDEITFSAVISNTGTIPAGSSTLIFKVGGETFGDTIPIPSLNVGQTVVVQRKEYLNVAQHYQNTILLDILDEVAESDELNNEGIQLYTVIQGP